MSERVYLLVLGFLGLCAFTGFVGMVLAEVLGKDIPPGLAAATGTCIGALGGTLSLRAAPPVSGGPGKPP